MASSQSMISRKARVVIPAAFIQGTWAAWQLGERPPAVPVHPVAWHAMPVEEVLEQLRTTPAGLPEHESTPRRSELSRAELVQPSLTRAVLEELNNPLTPILLGGTVLSASLGSVVDAALVAGVAALSALVGGVQRLHTDRALAQLLDRSAVTAGYAVTERR